MRFPHEAGLVLTRRGLTTLKLLRESVKRLCLYHKLRDGECELWLISSPP